MSRFIRTAGQTPGIVNLGQCAINTSCSITSTCNFCGNAKGLCNTNLDLISSCSITSCSTIGSSLIYCLPTNCYEEFCLRLYNLSSTCAASNIGCWSVAFGNDCCFCCGSCLCIFAMCAGVASVCYASGGNCFEISRNPCAQNIGNIFINLKPSISCCCLSAISGELCILTSAFSCVDYYKFRDNCSSSSLMFWTPATTGSQRFTRVGFFASNTTFCNSGNFYWELYGRKYQNITYTG